MKHFRITVQSAETMQAFLKYFHEKYGGAEEYVRRYVGMTDEDIAIIKRNTLLPAP